MASTRSPETTADARRQTDWVAICAAYDRLLQMTDSPVVRANRALGAGLHVEMVEGRLRDAIGAAALSTDGIRLRLPFVPTGESQTATLPEGAVQPDTASNLLGAAGLTAAAGAGSVRAQ